jgi:hypothetical protein
VKSDIRIMKASSPDWRDRLAVGPWQAVPELGSKMKRLLRGMRHVRPASRGGSRLAGGPNQEVD